MNAKIKKALSAFSPSASKHAETTLTDMGSDTSSAANLQFATLLAYSYDEGAKSAKSSKRSRPIHVAEIGEQCHVIDLQSARERLRPEPSGPDGPTSATG